MLLPRKSSLRQKVKPRRRWTGLRKCLQPRRRRLHFLKRRKRRKNGRRKVDGMQGINLNNAAAAEEDAEVDIEVKVAVGGVVGDIEVVKGVRGGRRVRGVRGMGIGWVHGGVVKGAVEEAEILVFLRLLFKNVSSECLHMAF